MSSVSWVSVSMFMILPISSLYYDYHTLKTVEPIDVVMK